MPWFHKNFYSYLLWEKHCRWMWYFKKDSEKNMWSFDFILMYDMVIFNCVTVQNDYACMIVVSVSVYVWECWYDASINDRNMWAVTFMFLRCSLFYFYYQQMLWCIDLSCILTVESVALSCMYNKSDEILTVTTSWRIAIYCTCCKCFCTFLNLVIIYLHFCNKSFNMSYVF